MAERRCEFPVFVVEPRPGVHAHRRIQEELDGVGALHHAGEGVGLHPVGDGLLLPVEPGGHGEEVLETQGPLALVQVGEAPSRKEIQDRLLDAREEPFPDGDAHQHGGDALGAGAKLVPHSSPEWIEVRVEHQPAVTDDQHAVDGVALSLDRIQQIHQVLRIQPHLFGSGRRPIGCRSRSGRRSWLSRRLGDRRCDRRGGNGCDWRGIASAGGKEDERQ